jgi:hypothetical protein|tara:strand:+ start:21 stop:632 length:612 start_codon:yes stop_codon:yes gene_type:complete
MSIQKKKFEKLSKELIYQKSELEYVKEILKEAHWEFEEFYREYCRLNDIDLQGLNKKHASKIDKLFPSLIEQKHDSDGNLETKRVEMKDNTDLKEFKRIYREIAKILHPDKGGDEKEFKRLSESLDEKDWSVLLEMCAKHNIEIESHKEINKLIQKKIEAIKEKILKEKSTYSWSLYECEESKTCRENVVKKFLKHLFDYNDY